MAQWQADQMVQAAAHAACDLQRRADAALSSLGTGIFPVIGVAAGNIKATLFGREPRILQYSDRRHMGDMRPLHSSYALSRVVVPWHLPGRSGSRSASSSSHGNGLVGATLLYGTVRLTADCARALDRMGFDTGGPGQDPLDGSFEGLLALGSVAPASRSHSIVTLGTGTVTGSGSKVDVGSRDSMRKP